MNNGLIMDKNALRRTVIRLSHEICEKNADLTDVVLVGIRRGGAVVAERVAVYLAAQGVTLPRSGIDISAYRDDVEKAATLSPKGGLDVSVDGKTVILCDDVLQTGRSVRAAMAGIFAAGRPKGVQLLVLVDRGGREVPVRADYVGKNAPVSPREYVRAEFEELGAAEDKIYVTRLS